MKRAAQFAPFEALTGYGDMIKEAARETVEKAQQEEDARQELDRRLQYLLNHGSEKLIAVFSYFAEDRKKTGGEYRVIRGQVKRVDQYKKDLILSDGTRIPLNDLYSIESDAFSGMDEDF